ncbi:MAG: heparinase II/III family protein [Clostridia bacterium]|nr:heparinase II/III family protein [Clostridia bacterium]
MIGKQILADAKKKHPDHNHPRILLSDADFVRIKENKDDPVISAAIAKMHEIANKAMEAPCTQFAIPDGIRLLVASRNVLARVRTLAQLYKIEGNEAYAERAYLELEEAASWENWNPRHFLDTAELSAAFAFGYDWLYDYLTEERRAVLRDAMWQKGVMAVLDDYRNNERSRTYRWYQDKPGDNWKMVCNGGITMAILSAFEDFPADICEEALTCAFLDTHEAVRTFYSAIDGNYSEGPTYWGYATMYLAYYSKTLCASCGTDYELTNWEGLRKSPVWLINMASNDQMSFNFGDAASANVCSDLFFWIANRFGDNELSTLRKNLIIKNPTVTGSETLFYYVPGVEDKALALPTSFAIKGNDNASFRTGWGAEDLFAAIHFGKNNAYHGHLDMGTFILNVGSTRFFHDFPPDNYNLKPYSGTYRFRAEGHSTLVINPSKEHDQLRTAKATLGRVQAEVGKDRFAIADMSEAFPGKESVRGLKLTADLPCVIVQDEIRCLPEDRIVWAAQTKAEILLSEDKKSAILTLDGKRLYAALLSDELTLSVADCAPTELSPEVEPARSEGSNTFKPQTVNTGYQKLVIDATGKDAYTLAVAFLPLADGEDAPKALPKLSKLALW